MFGYMRPEQTGLKWFYFFVNNKATYTRAQHWEVHAWCQDQFGLSDDERWSSFTEGSFFFFSGEDATAFRLRWC